MSSGIPRGVGRLVERLGISTFLLLFFAYFGFTAIIEPIADSYREMVGSVATTNSLLREELQRDDAKDEHRLDLAMMKLDRIIAMLERQREPYERPKQMGRSHPDRPRPPSDQLY